MPSTHPKTPDFNTPEFYTAENQPAPPAIAESPGQPLFLPPCPPEPDNCISMPAPSFPEYYQLGDGRLWDIAAGRFVQMRQTPANILNLPDEASLVDALDQFNLPHGDLEMKSAQAIRAKLKDLDNQYLTPRTLAGLSTSDPYALEQWQIHEQLAQPLRNALQELGEGV